MNVIHVFWTRVFSIRHCKFGIRPARFNINTNIAHPRRQTVILHRCFLFADTAHPPSYEAFYLAAPSEEYNYSTGTTIAKTIHLAELHNVLGDGSRQGTMLVSVPFH